MLGTMPQMTPIGTPTSQSFCSGTSFKIPTVFMSRTASATRWEAKRFLVILSSTLPNPVSLTAISASIGAA